MVIIMGTIMAMAVEMLSNTSSGLGLTLPHDIYHNFSAFYTLLLIVNYKTNSHEIYTTNFRYNDQKHHSSQ